MDNKNRSTVSKSEEDFSCKSKGSQVQTLIISRKVYVLILTLNPDLFRFDETNQSTTYTSLDLVTLSRYPQNDLGKRL